MNSPEQVQTQTKQVVLECLQAGQLQSGQLIVFGVSTSEVAGKRIGTAGASEWAEAIYEGIKLAQKDVSFTPVFQCCEHLNRALVMERAVAKQYGYECVSAIPVPDAGGSMAAYAYERLNEPQLVESVRAHAGIDIGDTLIGMHLRPVAVPARTTIHTIGQAHVTMAFTRPKLIGGARAVYSLPEQTE